MPIEHHELISIGATMGADYGKKHCNSPNDLQKINNFDWLNKIYLDI